MKRWDSEMEDCSLHLDVTGLPSDPEMFKGVATFSMTGDNDDLVKALTALAETRVDVYNLIVGAFVSLAYDDRSLLYKVLKSFAEHGTDYSQKRKSS